MSSARIRFIFWLMTLCIAAINAFQGYWLLTSFRENRARFRSTVQEALLDVVEGEQLARADALFGQKKPKPGAPGTPALPGNRKVIVRKFRSGPGSETRLYVRSNQNIPQSHAQDTLATRISKMLVLDWAEGGQVDKRKLFHAYRQALKRQNIHAAFVLDTLRIDTNPRMETTVLSTSIKRRWAAAQHLKTFPAPINPVKNLFVQATFDTPFFYLFKKMGGLLAASFVLLILTTACFVYMLSTILRQKRLSEMKNDFINNMTHELKTPIATVTAAVEAMMHYGVLDNPEKTKSYLVISQHNLGRLSELVEKVLNLAVEDKQEMQLHPEPVDLRVLIADITGNYLLKVGKQIHFKNQVPENEMVLVDRMHFANVLSNLTDNAVKYSNEEVTIVFDYEKEGKNWQLSIADTGIGIAKIHQQAVFERFFRVPTGNLHTVKGFGLGLPYVREVVERHGGIITLHSEPGKGSTFILKF